MSKATFVHPDNHSTTNASQPYYVTSGFIIDSLNQQEFEILIPSWILVLVVILLGLPGNIITVCVYMKKMRRTASRVFILALAFCDLTNCILTMPVEMAIIFQFWTFDHPIICAIGRTLTYILNGCSALLLIGIAVDRFRKICRPLKPVFTPKQTRTICLASSALGFAVYIPGFVLYGTYTEEIPVGTNTIAIGKTCRIRDKYSQSKLRDYIISFWFLLTVAVMVALIVIYARIGKAVYTRLKLEEKRKNSIYGSKSNLSRKRKIVVDQESETSCSFDDNLQPRRKQPAKVLKTLSDPVKQTISDRLKKGLGLTNVTVYTVQRHQASQRIRAGRTTIMLFSVTIAYILSFIPFAIIVTIRSSTSPNYYMTLTSVQKSVWDLFLRSYVLNFAVNPVLYGFFNKDFRNKMVEFFGDCFCGQKTQNIQSE